MSDEAALLHAITADADDDTPRLVYADWLDEHDAPIQAEFVRTQCRLASGSAADADYPDLLERHAELVARFALAAKLTAPALPPGFAHLPDIQHGTDHFRRGFPYTASGDWNPFYDRAVPTDEQIERVCAGLAPLAATTTVRHLVLGMMTPDLLARVLVAPGAAALTGLTVQAADYTADGGDALVRALAGARSVATLESLSFGANATVAGLRALDGANLGRLRALDLPALQGPARDVPAVAQAGWFRGLRRARAGNVDRPLQEPLLAAFARLPHLDALDLGFSHATAHKAFGTATGWAALASLNCSSANFAAGHLARGTFPRLAELVARPMWPDAFRTLLGAKWLPQLRVLDVGNGSLTDASVVALARSAAAPHLRVLRIGRNRISKTGLLALADGARFPNLTTLDVRAGYTQTRPETLARFAAELSLPHLRHLHLDGWPLGDAGAKALAANPRLARLTRLTLTRCGVGESGFGAVVRSPHLQRLIELDAANNNLKRAAALLDAERLPELAAVGLYGNPLTAAARAKLHRARGIA